MYVQTYMRVVQRKRTFGMCMYGVRWFPKNHIIVSNCSRVAHIWVHHVIDDYGENEYDHRYELCKSREDLRYGGSLMICS